jgi:hypothetical protein
MAAILERYGSINVEINQVPSSKRRCVARFSLRGHHADGLAPCDKPEEMDLAFEALTA